MVTSILINFAISGFSLVKVVSGSDKDKVVKLSEEEQEMFWSFIDILLNQESTIIMRSESNKNLKNQFSCGANKPKELAKYIFMTGEKSQLCWNNMKYLDPDDITLDNFKKICKSLRTYIKEGCPQEWKNINRVFYNALNNEETFNRYRQLSENEKKKVNLYYLSIAHTIEYGYKKMSSFVSTTTDPNVVIKFFKSAIIYGWVPKILGSSVNANQPDINGLCIPSCDPVYPEEQEISLRCGFLPHFIIGFKINGKMYVNPAIFDAMRKIGNMDRNGNHKFIEDLIRKGLNIDQSNFDYFCNQTNFKRYYTFNGNDYEIHVLNR